MFNKIQQDLSYNSKKVISEIYFQNLHADFKYFTEK